MNKKESMLIAQMIQTDLNIQNEAQYTISSIKLENKKNIRIEINVKISKNATKYIVKTIIKDDKLVYYTDEDSTVKKDVFLLSETIRQLANWYNSKLGFDEINTYIQRAAG